MGPAFIPPHFQLKTGNFFKALDYFEDEFEEDYPCIAFKEISNAEVVQGTISNLRTAKQANNKVSFDEELWTLLNEESDDSFSSHFFKGEALENKQKLVRNKYLLQRYAKKMAMFRIVRSKFWELSKSLPNIESIFSAITGKPVHVDESRSSQDCLNLLKSHVNDSIIHLSIAYATFDIIIRCVCPSLYDNDLAIESIAGNIPIRLHNGSLSDQSIFDLVANLKFIALMKGLLPVNYFQGPLNTIKATKPNSGKRMCCF